MTNKNLINSISFHASNTIVSVVKNNKWVVLKLLPEMKILSTHSLFKSGILFADSSRDSKYIIFAGDGSSDKYPTTNLVIYNSHHKAEVATLTLKSEIIAARIASNTLVCVFVNKIVLYSISDLAPIETFETHDNPKGIVDYLLNEKGALKVLLTLGTEKGSIQIITFENGEYAKKNSFRVANSKVHSIKISTNGEQICTSSFKGTVLRIFNPVGQLLFEYRRGTKNAKIWNLSFSQNSQLLTLSSSSHTLHVWPLNEKIMTKEQRKKRVKKNGNYVFSSSLNSNMIRSKMKISIPFKEEFRVCFLGQNQIFVISVLGKILLYSVDLENNTISCGNKSSVQELLSNELQF
ncbi:wd-repeat protein interacting with phosphoinosides wipi -related [Anaeramoeba flamelloides]|uniref:Wd-repeat protein interacting with phosphoinosides wipi -related n=1 Tax=Anaeramoeba flamelloides TaxID=1746091 RepID=A0ABQ8Z2G3_9EUKA|nr:wd-repeat protein interacting with phosphoinosides wipi -related [Anaeramoeba flamelloides]